MRMAPGTPVKPMPMPKGPKGTPAKPEKSVTPVKPIKPKGPVKPRTPNKPIRVMDDSGMMPKGVVSTPRPAPTVDKTGKPFMAKGGMAKKGKK